MGSDRTIGNCLHLIRVEVKRRPQDGSLILNVALEVGRKQVCAFLGQDAKQLFERLEWSPLVEVCQFMSILQHGCKVELKIC
jgi:hypothetical protein